MLVSISLTNLAGSDKTNDLQESPLFKLRTKSAIGEVFEKIKLKFLGDRIFFIPFINKFQKESENNNVGNTDTMIWFKCIPNPSCYPNCFTGRWKFCPTTYPEC